MPNEYELEMTRGGLALRRHWVPDAAGRLRPPIGGGGSRAYLPGRSTQGRVQEVWSRRSRRHMRFEFSALPWELLGPRPAMVTLTYPGDWRLYVPHSRELVRHREAFKERWRKRFGMPVGVWVAEFQRRGAPHLHLYLGLPDAVSDADYALLQARTMARKRREYDVGPYEARRRTPPVPGEFGEWLRGAWWEIVGSGLPAHYKRGVDVAVAFFSERAEVDADRVKVAEYFWRESGKWAQKEPPDDFGSLKFYGRWGQKAGFKPVVSVEAMNEAVGLELRRMLRRLMRVKLREQAQRTGRRVTARTGRSRGRDGLTVFGVDGNRLGPRMLECAEQIALDKARSGQAAVAPRGEGGVAWRALSEREKAAAESWVMAEEWRRARDEDEDPEGVLWSPVWEAEAEKEREFERECDIHDAVDAEAERLQQINAIRVAHGLAPRPDPERLRIVLPRGPGRGREAR